MSVNNLSARDQSSTTLSPADHEDLRFEVSEALSRRLGELESELDAISPDARALAQSGRRFVEGGKRLRAAFCYWGWRGAGGDPSSPQLYTVVQVCAALELFQAAALVHDDIMDCSDTRRGAPSVHREFEKRHRENGWNGDAVQFGESAALLVGDLFLIDSERVFTHAVRNHDDPSRHAAQNIFDEMRAEVTIGQYLDVLAEVTPWGVNLSTDLARSRAIIRAKSARYSVEHPLVMGAALNGAGPADRAAWSAVGLPVGEAFQLRDDVLGIYGNPAVTGKPAGDDLREGKRTVLVAHTLASSSPTQRALVQSALGNQALTVQDLDAVRDIMIETGAVDQVEKLITDLLETADSAMTRLDIATRPREVLGELIVAATQRYA